MPDILSKLAGKIGEVNTVVPLLFGVIVVAVLSFLAIGAAITKNTEKRSSYLMAAGIVLGVCLAFSGIAGIVSWIQS